MENKKIAVLGIGNRLKRDDGAGSIIAENLSLRGLTAFDSAVVPENFTGALRKAAPDTLIIVDACAMGLKPGEFRKIALRKVENEDTFNSHSPGVIELVRYLKEFIPEIIFIGIEPGSTELGEGLSPEVSEAVIKLEKILTEADASKINLLVNTL
jgi:hydrogenase 3 maturation protease